MWSLSFQDFLHVHTNSAHLESQFREGLWLIFAFIKKKKRYDDKCITLQCFVHTDSLLRIFSLGSKISDLMIKHFFLLDIMCPSQLIAYELIDWVDGKIKAQMIRKQYRVSLKN